MSKTLVVDGNRAEWGWFTGLLGDGVRFASTIEKGIEMAAEWSPDVILLASLVGNESGVEAVVDFLGASKRSQIVCMSLAFVENTGKAALEAGATLYVSKADPHLLCAAVELARGRAAPDLSAVPPHRAALSRD